MDTICVTGTPGTGKTTFSRKLARKLDLAYVDLNTLLLEETCTEGYDDDRETYVLDLEKGRRLLRERLTSASHVAESHIAHLVVPIDLTSVCFVLRCSPYELKERLVDKGFSGQKLRENLEAEILGVISAEAIEAYGREKVCEFDTSGGLDDLIGEALDILEGRKKVASGFIDWLGLLMQKGELQAFLA
ncbi:MAG: adenylate kinase family protein [Candidatus Geothermarchaeales archaeon]